ncbi:peptidoglycan/LPS O-acetylase OafA/YrhL [Pseudomonas sp. TE3786]
MVEPQVSKTIKAAQLLKGIHGLRGVAAIAIVLFHSHYMANLALPDAFWFIHRDFGFAVHLFLC